MLFVSLDRSKATADKIVTQMWFFFFCCMSESGVQAGVMSGVHQRAGAKPEEPLCCPGITIGPQQLLREPSCQRPLHTGVSGCAAQPSHKPVVLWTETSVCCLLQDDEEVRLWGGAKAAAVILKTFRFPVILHPVWICRMFNGTVWWKGKILLHPFSGLFPCTCT